MNPACTDMCTSFGLASWLHGAAPNRTTILRDVVSTVLLSGTAQLTPQHAQATIDSLAGSDGGSQPNGGILVFATPSQGASSNPSVHGFVYEGDKKGGAMRLPAEVLPMTSNGIMASNHYWSYPQLDQMHPERCNGIQASFSSLWRYEAGKNKVEAWTRGIAGLDVGIGKMRELLQTVGHGTTEHSIIFLPDQMRFEVAIAAANSVWDAQYREWHSFTFEELFR